MVTDIQYAQMAGAAYVSNRSKENKFPIPTDWTPLKYKEYSSGFEAVSFQRGNEIVISFAGTNNAIDWIANSGLATGIGSIQLYQAAEYYLQIKALYPDAEISFTGHSLGGGLAALLGVFFDKKAVTFDQAPFQNSATESVRDKIINYLMASNEALLALAPELISFTNSSLASRDDKISGKYVQGEFLSKYLLFSTIGSQVPISHGTPSISSVNLYAEGKWAVNLHSQTLLTAFVMNDIFRDVTNRLTDLEPMLFDKGLYATPIDVDDKQNFLELLVRHEVGSLADTVTGVDAVADDDMLTRFTNDLLDIAQDGGLSLANNNVVDRHYKLGQESSSGIRPRSFIFEGECIRGRSLRREAGSWGAAPQAAPTRVGFLLLCRDYSPGGMHEERGGYHGDCAPV